LPEEDGFWEVSWYTRGDGTFKATTIPNVGGRDLSLGFLVSFSSSLLLPVLPLFSSPFYGKCIHQVIFQMY
jgi:hypothetical protein